MTENYISERLGPSLGYEFPLHAMRSNGGLWLMCFQMKREYGLVLEIFRRQDEKGCLIDCTVLGFYIVRKEGTVEHHI